MINNPATLAWPKISIVTPSYNQGQFIEQTINSILDQNYPNLEYIIIDGGSTDNTVEIIKKYESKISFWISEKDNGQSEAINKGIAKCTGVIFNWINSDDYLEPTSLFTIAQEYLDKPYTALCGQVNVIDDTVFSHVRKPSSIAISTENSIADFNINQEGTWWCLDKIKQLKGVNPAFHYTMDLDLWIRALSSSPFESFRTTDIILSNYRRHEMAKSTINKNSPFLTDNFRKEELMIFDQFIPENKKFDSYFTLFEMENCTYSIPLEYKIDHAFKKTVTEIYLFKLAKQFFYSNELKLATQCLDSLNEIGITQNLADIEYIRKKIRIKSWMFWK